jgi:outer membrane protein TolC
MVILAPRSRARRLLHPALVVAGLLAGASAVASGETPPGKATLPNPLSLAAAMERAAAGHPEVDRTRAEIAAADHQSVVAGAGTPPMIMAGIDKLPLSMHGVDFMVLGQYGFPLSDVRDRRAEAARRQGQVGRAALAALSVALPEAAGQAFVDAWQAERRVEAIDAAAAVARSAAVLARERTASGGGGVADVLRAETELATLAGNRAAALATVRARRAGLAAALGLDELPPTLRLADPPEPPAEAARLAPEAVVGAPLALGRAAADVRVAEAENAVAAARYGAELSLQGGAMISTMEAPALVAMVGFTLPFDGAVRDAAEAEAAARLVGARASARAEELAWRRSMAEARAELDAALALRAALSDEIRPRARQAVELLVAAYGAGREGLGALLDAARALADLDARLVEARAEVLRRQLRWARVCATAPTSPPEVVP